MFSFSPYCTLWGSNLKISKSSLIHLPLSYVATTQNHCLAEHSWPVEFSHGISVLTCGMVLAVICSLICCFYSKDRAIALPLSLVKLVEEQGAGFMSR